MGFGFAFVRLLVGRLCFSIVWIGLLGFLFACYYADGLGDGLVVLPVWVGLLTLTVLGCLLRVWVCFCFILMDLDSLVCSDCIFFSCLWWFLL